MITWLPRLFGSRSSIGWALLLPAFATSHSLGQDAALQAQIERGRTLYALNCLVCHQVTGQGSPGAFPPLANSDYLARNPDKAILAMVEGLSGPITVNGRKFDGVMPPVLLKDEQVADVLTFVKNSWGNSLGGVTPIEVKRVRSRSKYPTFEALMRANSFEPLPDAPVGTSVRELVRLPAHGVRMFVKTGQHALYVLGNDGAAWKIDTQTSALRQVLWGKNYLDTKLGSASTVGFTFDQKNRIYVVADHRSEKGSIVTNHVVIYRSASESDGEPADLKPWFAVSYPWGIGPFNHGVGHIAQGPDGLLYIGSGSRTDGNESGKDKRFSTAGEDPLTACIWRLNPESEAPKLEIYSRGHRNPYGFCWNAKGEMFATDNGPDANMPEELNEVIQGAHYGFPYQYGDSAEKPYPYTPEAPVGTKFVFPIANHGPAAAGQSSKPIFTFDPHSSPAGIVYLPDSWPSAYRESFLLVRFGNLLKTPTDVGFDLLQARLTRNVQGKYEGTFHTLLAPLARPIDLSLGAAGKVYILEYTRTTKFGGALSFPGRILEWSLQASP